ncbi:hypothetical protein F5146DRAFT_1071495 [Armillaria mellea]|nr:hypothetical protein F5146DRAFT_1071495 [Armillaria mellea]
MLLSHLSFKTLPANLLHFWTRFSSTIARRSKRWECPDCHMNMSCHQDLTEHMKIHAKTAENYRVCPDCPVLLPQACNLDGHRLRHHSGDEKFKCTEDPDCVWGGSTEDGLAHHRRKYHSKAPPSEDGISNKTPSESEPTVEPPPSSASLLQDLNVPADVAKTHTDKPIVSPATPFNDQAQVATRDRDGDGDGDVGFFSTSPGTGSKHGDPCYSPGAKQLFHAVDDIPSLGGTLIGMDTGEVALINDPLGLMEDAMNAMNAINLFVSGEAPARSYYGTTHHTYARPSSWDGPNFGKV